MLPRLRPAQVPVEALSDRPQASCGWLDAARVERPGPGVGLGFEARGRPTRPDQVPDLMEGDEVGDLTTDLGNRYLQIAPDIANRPPPSGRARDMNPVFGADLLHMRFQEDDPCAAWRFHPVSRWGHSVGEPIGAAGHT